MFLQAGQATEPECLVAVGLAAGDDGQVRKITCMQYSLDPNIASLLSCFPFGFVLLTSHPVNIASCKTFMQPVSVLCTL